jgi:hypothetical protein
MGSLTAPPGSPAPSGAAAAQALFMEARRRRRRRWLAGIAAALVAAAVLAVSAVTWLPRAFGRGVGGAEAAGAAAAGRSPGLAGHARFTYRVVTAGVPEAYGTEDVTFSGDNRSFSFSQASLARGGVTFLGYAKIALSKPVSTAAVRNYQRAQRAEQRTIERLDRNHARTGKPIPGAR